MSFTGDAKAALCALFVKKRCCRRALLLGILRAAGLFSEDEIRFTTRSRPTAHLTAELLSEQFGLTLDILDDTATREGEGEGNYQILLTEEDACMISACFPMDGDGWRGAVPAGMDCPACMTAYIRGVFLSCGNVADPEACYHLDMVLSEDRMAEQFALCLREHGVPPKHTARKGLPVLYYKESESIEDFLNLIGAQKAAFAVMNTKIMKEIRNTANRQANCELANIGKTVGAATIQYEAIRTLLEEDRFDRLPVELRETAQLRYAHPELPLKDLAALHTPPLTKSGLNHRLKRIVDFASTENAKEAR